uniref:Kruppel like factor 7 n=1 Tax=Myotis myotis TaxID=51298 RepID=A0A7J7WHD0_MYOMY|nr:Kruppel like factor 7 [Myotis myotis]
MDVLASYSIFQELQLVHDTGYFSALPSLEETWQQGGLLFQMFLETVICVYLSTHPLTPYCAERSSPASCLRLSHQHTSLRTRCRAPGPPAETCLTSGVRRSPVGTRLRVLRAVADRIARPSMHELGTFNPVHFFVLTTIRLGRGDRGEVASIKKGNLIWGLEGGQQRERGARG